MPNFKKLNTIIPLHLNAPHLNFKRIAHLWAPYRQGSVS